MKTFRNASELLSEVDALLEKRRTRSGDRVDPHPLEHLLVVLLEERRYDAVELALNLAEQQAIEFTLGACNHPLSKFATPVRIASNHLGELRVFSAREDAISAADRVLLKQVAQRIARFLTGTGKYVLRRARTESETAATIRVASAGDDVHS